jgi:hypothetical protein
METKKSTASKNYISMVIRLVDEEKASIFGEVPREVFSEEANPNFDNEHKIFVENFIMLNKNSLFQSKPS